MIALERSVAPAAAGDAAALLARMDHAPGAWIGCDIDAEGMLRRHAYACVDPPVAFYLDGARLRIVPRTALGHALAAAIAGEVAPTAAFDRVEGRYETTFGASDTGPHPLVAVLRRTLALFTPGCTEFGFYGALAFDAYRLEHGDALPEDGRRRLVLFLPERVLHLEGDRAEWVTFAFPGLVQAAVRRHTAVPAPVPRAPHEPVVELAPGGHARNVARAIERLREGDLYSIVLSQTLRRRADVLPSRAFSLLRERNPYPAMFALNLGGGESIFGASPDLQVEADAEWVQTAPVCGTFRRGADPYDDAEQGRALLNSPKEDASLTVCADADRNDKAQVCVPGSVEHVARRRLHFFSTIVHTIDFIRGRRRADVDAFDILLAHLTPPTVTGFPKPLARAVIASIEPDPRGWYAGAAVRIGSDDSCEALTMLRFARVIDGIADVRVGGALVVDADPEREEAETRLKAETLFRVLAGEPPVPPPRPAPARTTALVTLVARDDPFASLVGEALVRAGATRLATPGAQPSITVVLGRGPFDASSAAPTLLLGEAAIDALERDGARVVRLAAPRYGRALACNAIAGTPLAARERFTLGTHAARAVLLESLPAPWQAWATARVGDGPLELVVAVDEGTGRIAIAARPEATRSGRFDAGTWLLATTLECLRTGGTE